MSLLQTVLVAYVILLCLAGFITAFIDKRRARQGAWRIPEKTFLLLALAGGGLGVLLSFFLFRHKTRHAGLMFGVLGLTVLWIAVAWVVYSL